MLPGKLARLKLIVYVSPTSMEVPVHETADPEVEHVPAVQATSDAEQLMDAVTTGAGLTVAGEVMVNDTDAIA